MAVVRGCAKLPKATGQDDHSLDLAAPSVRVPEDSAACQRILACLVKALLR
jgi:hypothetical protein